MRGAPRRGLSLSIKMIATTTLLLVLTVAGIAFLDLRRLREAADEAKDRRIAMFKAGRETLGERAVPLFARAIEWPLIDKGQDSQILQILRENVLRDTTEVDGRTDLGLRLAYVMDLNQHLTAHCIETERLDCTAGDHEPLKPAIGALTLESWRAALDAWRASPPAGDALVRFDLAAGGARFRGFAYPVFTGVAPTPAAAVPEKPPDERLGYVVLVYDLAPIEWFAATAEAQKSAAERSALLYSAVVGSLFAVMGTILAILQGLSISRPIKELAYRVDQIARGDLTTRVEVKSHNEIGILGENFNYMADQIAILLQHTAEKARIDQELEVVKAIQETLVPSSETVRLGALELCGFYLPAAQTGGDWWTWHQLVGGRVLVVIGDVTGHGVPSAIITAAAKAACDVARHVHADNVTVVQLLEIMNRAILESAQRRFAMTCFASIIDPKARTITFANAGHNLPYLLRGSDGKGELGALTSRAGNRLGDEATSTYESRLVELMPGDMIVWYTDGLVECDSPAGEQFGDRRFRTAVKRAAGLEAAAARDAIITEARAFYAESQRSDDITMVVGRIR